MKITIEPTREQFDAPINGAIIPLRVWFGRTEGGIPIEAFILSITPNDPAQGLALRAELPPFMRPSRETFTVDLPEH